MLAKFFFFVSTLVSVSAVTLKTRTPNEDGFMHPWDQGLENDNDEIDLHAAISEDDAPDTRESLYAPAHEDIGLEKADDESLNWKIGNRKIKVVHDNSEAYDNSDMW